MFSSNTEAARTLPVMLVALNATSDAPWGLMHAKVSVSAAAVRSSLIMTLQATALASYLSEPITRIGDLLSVALPPPQHHTRGAALR